MNNDDAHLLAMLREWIDEHGIQAADSVPYVLSVLMNEECLNFYEENPEDEDGYLDRHHAVEVLEATVAGLDIQFGRENPVIPHESRLRAIEKMQALIQKMGQNEKEFSES